MHSLQQHLPNFPFAPEPIHVVITVPQRKVRAHDKNRLRWKDAKHMALHAADCGNTSEVRKWLKFLDVRSIKLTMTMGWVAIRKDLAEKIKLVRRTLSGIKATASSMIRLGDHKGKQQKRQSDADILLQAMRDAIAASNWEFARRELVERQAYKAAAWALLTEVEKKQIYALVPIEVKLLKAALKRGEIAAFKENEDGGLFWVWTDTTAEPQLISGTRVRNYFNGASKNGISRTTANC